MSEESTAVSDAQRLIRGLKARAELPHGADREVEMAKRYALGETLDEIGKDYDLSRERVRQLINLSGWRAPEILRARRVLEAEENKLVEERDRRAVQEWSYANPGKSRQEAADTLGLPLSAVLKFLGSRKNLHPLEVHRESNPKWSDKQLIEMLREFNEHTGSTVSTDFEKWSVARGGPTHQTPTIRFGTWSAALKAAGVTGSYSVERDRRFTDEDLWAALVEFFSFERKSYSYSFFTSWLASHSAMPSGAHIRQRLRISWTEMSAVAQRVATGRIGDLDPDWVHDVRTQRNWQETIPEEPDVQGYLKRAVADIGTVVTLKSYDEWAHSEDAPAGIVLMRKTGQSWAELVHEAGGLTGTRGRRGKISDAELLQSLVEYMETRTEVRYADYSDWARANQRPVAGTLARLLGGWENAVDAAKNLAEAQRTSVD